MTDFPTTVTEEQAELFLQASIGGQESSGKFANNKNNAGIGSQPAVTGTALWNYIYHQDQGAGIADTNYVYGRDGAGNVKDLLTNPQERIFYNPVGTAQGLLGTETNNVYGAIRSDDKTIKGIVNHGLYTHWRKIIVDTDGINTIGVPTQSVLFSNTQATTQIYSTSWGTPYSLTNNLPKDGSAKLGGTGTELLAANLNEQSYRLDTISAVSSTGTGPFNAAAGYTNITTPTNNGLGSASYHLGGMYDLLINVKTPGDDGKFKTSGATFNGTNGNGPKIYAEKFSSSDNTFTSAATDFSSNNKYFIPRMVVNNAPLLTSVDINLSLGQTPENGFVDSNVVSEASNVLELDNAKVKTAVGDTITYDSVHISPLADSALLNGQVGAKKATNTPNTVPGEIVAFNIDTSGAGINSTFHGVKIPVTPPGVHLGGMGLRGIVLIARRILMNKGVTGDLETDPDYGVYNYVSPASTGQSGSTDDTKFARLIAGVMNKIGQLNTVDTGAEPAVIADAQSLFAAYGTSAETKKNFLGIPSSDTGNKSGTTVGRRAYNALSGSSSTINFPGSSVGATTTLDVTDSSTFILGQTVRVADVNDDNGSIDGEYQITSIPSGSKITISVSTTGTLTTPGGGNSTVTPQGNPNLYAQSFDQYLAAIAGAFLGAGIFLSASDWATFFAGINGTTSGTDAWMNATNATVDGVRGNMSGVLFTLPTAITDENMGELVRGIYDATCEDIPAYLGDYIPQNTAAQNNVQNALKRELTLFKIDGKPAAQDKLVHISVDDLEYGYSNAKPGMPFFRKGYISFFGSELYNEPWKQPVCHSGNLSKGFIVGEGVDNQDDMLYDGGLPPPNRCEKVIVATGSTTLTNTWSSTNSVNGASKSELIMNLDSLNLPGKETKTGNNFTGYPYELDYFSTALADRSRKYGKPKYRWAYYFDDDTDTSGTTSGGVFL